MWYDSVKMTVVVGDNVIITYLFKHVKLFVINFFKFHKYGHCNVELRRGNVKWRTKTPM